jgi:hypothetical protein
MIEIYILFIVQLILFVIASFVSLPIAMGLFLFMVFYTIPKFHRIRQVKEFFDTASTIVPAGNPDSMNKWCIEYKDKLVESIGSLLSEPLMILKTVSPLQMTDTHKHVEKYLYGYVAGRFDEKLEIILQIMMSFYPPATSNDDLRKDDMRFKIQRFYRYLIYPRLLQHRAYTYSLNYWTRQLSGGNFSRETSVEYQININPTDTTNNTNNVVVFTNVADLRKDSRFTIYQRIISDPKLCYSYDETLVKRNDIPVEKYLLCDPIQRASNMEKDTETYKGELLKNDPAATANVYDEATMYQYLTVEVLNKTFVPDNPDAAQIREGLRMKRFRCEYAKGQYYALFNEMIQLIWTIKQYLYENRNGEDDTMYKYYCSILLDIYTLRDKKQCGLEKSLNCANMTELP